MHKYPLNDMDSVYTHYDKEKKKNVQTPNTLDNTPKEEDNKNFALPALTAVQRCKVLDYQPDHGKVVIANPIEH
jgi:hypothetical protein